MRGKVAIITGGASGIGLAIVERLTREGVNCVIADLETSGGERAATKLKKAGADCLFVATNVSQPSDVRHLIEAAMAKFGRLDILVNNAGLQFVASIVDFPEERWDTLIGVMLTGTFLCSKYTLPHMIRQKWGRIINISSVHGKVASPFKVAYISAKHGVLGLTKVVALEMAENNITCNAICPAYVRTPLVERQIADQARVHGISEQDVVQKILLAPAAIRRMLEPSEVASLVVYLCSDDAAGITGTALDIDLGWTAR